MSPTARRRKPIPAPARLVPGVTVNIPASTTGRPAADHRSGRGRRRPAARDRGIRAGQAVRRGRGRSRHRPHRPRRRDIRFPRPQRRGKDHHHQDSLHAGQCHVRDGQSGRIRHGDPARRGAAQYRACLSGHDARRLPHRGAEPQVPRRALRRAQGRPYCRGCARYWTWWAYGTARTAWSARSPAACSGGWRSPAACCMLRTCCSSTSRRSAWIRRPGRRSGPTSTS